MWLWTGRDELLVVALVIFVLFVLPSLMWCVAKRRGRLLFRGRQRDSSTGRSNVR